MESKRKQISENFFDLNKAVHKRVLNKTTTEAELAAITEKLLQCCIDVKAITVRPVESKRLQWFENLCYLSEALQERVCNETTTEAELDAISEKLLQCCIDVKAITVRPVEGEGPSEKPSKAEAKP